MLKLACPLCKIVGLIAIIGLLNLGVFGIFQVSFIDKFLGSMPMVVRGLNVLFGLAGAALLVSFFMVCPKCKESKCA